MVEKEGIDKSVAQNMVQGFKLRLLCPTGNGKLRVWMSPQTMSLSLGSGSLRC